MVIKIKKSLVKLICNRNSKKICGDKNLNYKLLNDIFSISLIIIKKINHHFHYFNLRTHSNNFFIIRKFKFKLRIKTNFT